MLRFLAGPVFVVAGSLHFVIPKAYRRIMPPYVPATEAMVYASGVAEIAGGVGLMLKYSRRAAGWWLVATLVAVFPANLHMALNPEDYPEIPGGAPALWARLPFQAVFIGWVLSAMRRKEFEPSRILSDEPSDSVRPPHAGARRSIGRGWEGPEPDWTIDGNHLPSAVRLSC